MTARTPATTIPTVLYHYHKQCTSPGCKKQSFGRRLCFECHNSPVVMPASSRTTTSTMRQSPSLSSCSNTRSLVKRKAQPKCSTKDCKHFAVGKGQHCSICLFQQAIAQSTSPSTVVDQTST